MLEINFSDTLYLCAKKMSKLELPFYASILEDNKESFIEIGYERRYKKNESIILEEFNLLKEEHLNILGIKSELVFKDKRGINKYCPREIDISEDDIIVGGYGIDKYGDCKDFTATLGIIYKDRNRPKKYYGISAGHAVIKGNDICTKRKGGTLMVLGEAIVVEKNTFLDYCLIEIKDELVKSKKIKESRILYYGNTSGSLINICNRTKVNKYGWKTDGTSGEIYSNLCVIYDGNNIYRNLIQVNNPCNDFALGRDSGSCLIKRGNKKNSVIGILTDRSYSGFAYAVPIKTIEKDLKRKGFDLNIN